MIDLTTLRSDLFKQERLCKQGMALEYIKTLGANVWPEDIKENALGGFWVRLSPECYSKVVAYLYRMEGEPRITHEFAAVRYTWEPTRHAKNGRIICKNDTKALRADQYTIRVQLEV